MKTIESVMTSSPHSIGSDIPLAKAHEKMRELKVRHLPVLSGGRLVGVLSDRDLKLAAKFPGDLTVEEAMTPDPYVVGPEASLKEVVSAMAERKLGSALIAGKDGKPLGIFTAVDGMRLLAASLG